MLATHPRTLYFFRFRSWFEIAFGTGVVLSATYWITYILSTKRRSFDVNTSGYVDYIEVRRRLLFMCRECVCVLGP